jgi:putative ABC transport system permease protein
VEGCGEQAVVDGIGLSGTLSINVIERRREIGVMRAVGADVGDIIGIPPVYRYSIGGAWLWLGIVVIIRPGNDQLSNGVLVRGNVHGGSR